MRESETEKEENSDKEFVVYLVTTMGNQSGTPLGTFYESAQNVPQFGENPEAGKQGDSCLWDAGHRPECVHS